MPLEMVFQVTQIGSKTKSNGNSDNRRSINPDKKILIILQVNMNIEKSGFLSQFSGIKEYITLIFGSSGEKSPKSTS